MKGSRDNEAHVSDGMSDVMAGSTIAFMSITVLMIICLLAILLVSKIKDEESPQTLQLQSQVRTLQEELKTMRAQRDAAQAGGATHVSAGYEMWEVENESESGSERVTFLTDIKSSNYCDKPMDVRLVCRVPGPWDSTKLQCSKNGSIKSRGVVPR